METIVDIDERSPSAVINRQAMDIVGALVAKAEDKGELKRSFGAFCFTNAWEGDAPPQWFFDMRSYLKEQMPDLPEIALTELLLKGLIAALVFDQ